MRELLVVILISLAIGIVTFSGLMILDIKWGQRPPRARRSTAETARTPRVKSISTPKLRRALAAVAGILASESARSGWFGNIKAADFVADLRELEENERSVMNLSQLITDISSLSNSNATDRTLLEEAQQKIAALDQRSDELVQLLETSREKAELLDQRLREAQAQVLTEKKRQDIHTRMTAVLADLDTSVNRASSSGVDRISALASAYEETNGPNHIADRRPLNPLAARADQQLEWVAAGDPRGIYGEEGAELMDLLMEPPREPLGAEAKLATIAFTETDLNGLLTEQPPMWAHTAFLSVMVQRRAALAPRLRSVKLGFAEPKSFLDKAIASPRLVRAIDEYITLQDGLAGLMTSPAFQRMFDVEQRDPQSLLLAANRLMDYHEKFLELGESIRAISCKPIFVRVQKGMWELAVRQIENFDVFIERFHVLLESGAEGLRYGSGEVNLGQLRLTGGLDEETKESLLDLRDSVSRQL